MSKFKLSCNLKFCWYSIIIILSKTLVVICKVLNTAVSHRSVYRSIFLEMGFTEMPTNNYVESSFWNFDSLFQPQQHPARDAHDTFFVDSPATSENYPRDYMERVKKVHSHGGFGSQVFSFNCFNRS